MRNNPSDSVDGFLGYANQIYRGLGYLIDKLSTVLIEKDDDVVVSDDYGYLFLEQVKEKEKVIFRVTSPDFLKTLKNWVNLYINKKDKFNERTKCILTLVCRNEVDDDLILFNNAKNMEDCEEAYHKLIQRIKNIKDTSYRDFFTAHKNETIQILKIFEIYKPHKELQNELNDLIIKNLSDKISSNRFNNFIDQIIGWFFRLAVNEKNKKLSLIEIKYSDFLKKCLKLNGEVEIINYPTQEQICKNHNNYSDRYIKQLKIINMDKNIIDSATTDYLSWEYLRNNDFRDGRFSQEDLNNTYSNLYNSWNEKKLRVNMQPTLNSEDKGKALYLDCLEEKVYISGVSIQGNEKCISRGAYNFLANQDDDIEYSIGWHPDYKVRLNEG